MLIRVANGKIVLVVVVADDDPIDFVFILGIGVKPHIPERSALHIQVAGGDGPAVRQRHVGLSGCDVPLGEHDCERREEREFLREVKLLRRARALPLRQEVVEHAVEELGRDERRAFAVRRLRLLALLLPRRHVEDERENGAELVEADLEELAVLTDKREARLGELEAVRVGVHVEAVVLLRLAIEPVALDARLPMLGALTDAIGDVIAEVLGPGPIIV